jgi:choline dehydrogenase-like flavoprotein
MGEVCDFLVIGGGTAGCIVARRLAERSQGRIIPLEAGKADEGDPAAVDLSRLDEQTADYDWGFKASTLAGSEPQLNYPRARILGGCGNHNDCAFLRPPDSDFDLWAALGARDWNAAAMAPYYRRVLERVTVEPSPQHPVSRAFVEAGYELGLPARDFRQGAEAGSGWFPLNAKGKIRHSASVAYLHPLGRLPGQLDVRTQTQALWLIIENGRAIGAETSRGTMKARSGVILACGSIQTPQLMMLSGLGPAAHLRDRGIAVAADLPHVGKRLRDHVAAPIVFETHAPVAPWAICPFEATWLVKLDPGEPAPDILFHFGLRVREKYGDDPRLAFDGPAVKASPNVTRARSEGEVRLASPDPRAAPIIDLNYLSDPEGHDLGKLTDAMIFARRLLGTRAFSQVAKREVHPGPDVRTRADLQAFVRDTCETVYHPCGTCRIGDVVTPDLKVKGIDGLHIADASVFPSLITVNINCAVMMVAERAAEFIAAS